VRLLCHIVKSMHAHYDVNFDFPSKLGPKIGLRIIIKFLKQAVSQNMNATS